jgi:hypothetical protein
MKTLFIPILLLATFSLNAGSYEQAMEQAINKMQEANNVQDLQSAANSFERIAQMEIENWIPLYYQSHCLIMMSFATKEGASMKDEYLDAAQLSIDKAIQMADDEAELYCLQSLLHTARLVVDPMNRGQQMMPASGKALEHAMEIDPQNPRAQYLLLSNQIGQAQFFGQDPASFCPRILELLENWPENQSEIPFYPAWGLEETQELLMNCPDN